MKYNETLKNKHEQTRDETIKQVEDIINFIRDNEGENAVLSATKLSKLSGLSRSLFYKEHVLEVWNKELWEEKFGHKNTRNEYKTNKELSKLKDELEETQKQLAKYQKKALKLEEELEKEKKRKEVYQIDLEEQREINAKLRGEIMKLQQKVVAFGR